MADTPQPKPPASKTEKTLWEVPGVFKVGLINEEQPPPQPAMQHMPGNVTLPAALAALAILCAMFLLLGRRKRRSGKKP